MECCGFLCASVCNFVPLCETFSRSTIREPRNSNTTTSMFELFKRNNAAFSRGLGLLLVLFVFYGTTVEAAHCHGRIISTSSQAGTVVESDSRSGISTTKPGCNDCLICQLHQNFSATLISIKPIAESAPTIYILVF